MYAPKMSKAAAREMLSQAFATHEIRKIPQGMRGKHVGAKDLLRPQGLITDPHQIAEVQAFLTERE